MHFREMNKILKQLKYDENVASVRYLLADMCSDEERFWQWETYEAREQLGKFRQTKISEYEGRII